MATVQIPTALRKLTAGASELQITAATVRDALAEIDRTHPGFSAKVLDAGQVKPFIRIFVGPDDIAELEGLDTGLGERDEVSIIPAIAGGAA